MERVWKAVAQPGRERELLETLLAEIDALEDPSLDARRGRYLGWLALAADSSGAVREDEFTEARQVVLRQPPDNSIVAMTYHLSEKHIQEGRLDGAEAIAAFGLEAFAKRDPANELMLWRLRAEAARLAGDWTRSLELIRGMEAALAQTPALSAPFQEGFRAVIARGRAQVQLELGLPERCVDLLEIAREKAELAHPSFAQVRVEIELLPLDLGLVRESYQEVLDSVGRLRDELPRDKQNLLALPEALALMERARQTAPSGEGPKGDLEAARKRLAEGLAAERVTLLERLKLYFARCELELLAGDARAADEALRAASALSEGKETPAPLRELLLLPVFRWEIARRLGAGEADLAPLRPPVRQAYDALLKQWENTPLQPGGIGFLQLAWRAQVVGAALEVELDGQEPAATRRALTQLLRAQALGTEARTLGAAVPDLGQIQGRLLAAGRGALVLLPASQRSHLFLIGADSVRHVELKASRDELRELARESTRGLRQVTSAPNTGALARLSAELLPSEAQAELAGWKAAYALGFDLLGDLPFGLLRDGAGRPWGERLPYATLPSFVRGLTLAQDPLAGPTDLDLALVVAQHPGDADLPTLAFHDAERRCLTAGFLRVEVCEGSAASLATVRARDWRSARVTHFVAHGRRMADEGTYALVLERTEPDAPYELTPELVKELRFGPLVVLSVCSSGKGPERIGDDQLVSLAGAFLERGARCVVMARFPVEFGSTLKLMEAFSKNLTAGASPARALQEARAGMALGASDAYHAEAFEVIGLGHEPLFPDAR